MAKVTNPLDRALVQVASGQWFVYPNSTRARAMVIRPLRVLANFRTYCLMHEDADQAVLKKQWLRLVDQASDRVNIKCLDGIQVERSKPMLQRVYKTLPCPTAIGMTTYNLMPHTREVYAFLQSLGRIDEKSLREEFSTWYAENRERIKARQRNPWRFFQCHRPYLLEGHFLVILD